MEAWWACPAAGSQQGSVRLLRAWDSREWRLWSTTARPPSASGAAYTWAAGAAEGQHIWGRPGTGNSLRAAC